MSTLFQQTKRKKSENKTHNYYNNNQTSRAVKVNKKKMQIFPMLEYVASIYVCVFVCVCVCVCVCLRRGYVSI